MTFSKITSETATSSGLARLRSANSTVFGASNKMLWAVNEDLHGSSICSVASGVITLPVGYYYLLEASMGVIDTTTAGQNAEITLQFYNETTAASVGTKSFLIAARANVGEQFQTFSMDDASRLWVDATSGAGSVSFRQVGVSSTGYDFDKADQAGFGGRYVTGFSRCLVWRFD